MVAALQQDERVMAADAILSATIFGQGLPEAAARHLQCAAFAYSDEQAAESHLKAAQAEAPDHAAVLIGLYRFYFYRGRLKEALDIAYLCLAKGARENGLSADWREVRAGDAEFGDYGATPRFYLFTLKAAAYLSMRLGSLEEGRAMIAKLLELDPSDKIGAKVLLDVLERAEAGDDG
jgi:hypothetical protein